jgi:dipeptidyl aminopeptidase/acylaminoacyl peptidase
MGAMHRTPAFALLFILTLILLAACTAQPAASPPTVAEHSEGPTPTVAPSDEPTPSPTTGAVELHGQLAYVAGEDPQIHLLDIATGESRQLTQLRPEHAELTAEGRMRPVVSCGFGPGTLAWSPDGSQLAFSYGGCETVLYTVDLEGELTRIADGRSPAWSPDGRRLVFQPTVPFCMGADCGEPPHPGAWSLQVIDFVAGTQPEPLSLEPAAISAGQPAFSPDGTLIAFTAPLPQEEADPETFGAAYVMRADGSDPRLMARGAWSPGWLADGRLLIVEERTGDVHAIDLDTADGTALGGDAGPAVASPDGTRLLLTHSDPATGGFSTRLTTLDGEALAELAGSPVAWAPDSSAAVVLEVDDPDAALVFVGRDGQSLGRFSLPSAVNASFAAWRPGS